MALQLRASVITFPLLGMSEPRPARPRPHRPARPRPEAASPTPVPSPEVSSLSVSFLGVCSVLTHSTARRYRRNRPPRPNRSPRLVARPTPTKASSHPISSSLLPSWRSADGSSRRWRLPSRGRLRCLVSSDDITHCLLRQLDTKPTEALRPIGSFDFPQDSSFIWVSVDYDHRVHHPVKSTRQFNRRRWTIHRCCGDLGGY